MHRPLPQLFTVYQLLELNYLARLTTYSQKLYAKQEYVSHINVTIFTIFAFLWPFIKSNSLMTFSTW